MSSLMPSKPLMDQKQVAEHLGMSTKSIERWRLTGEGPEFIRFSGRCVRYRPEAVEAWLAARTAKSTSTPLPAEMEAVK